MTKTETRIFPELEAAPADWGHFDTYRRATAAELLDTDNACSECAQMLTPKMGWTYSGPMVGHRDRPEDPWTWVGPLCHPCTRLHRVADGYAEEEN